MDKAWTYALGLAVINGAFDKIFVSYVYVLINVVLVFLLRCANSGFFFYSFILREPLS